MPNFCTNCGSKLIEGSKFCGECGSQVGSASTPSTSTPKKNTVAPKSVASPPPKNNAVRKVASPPPKNNPPRTVASPPPRSVPTLRNVASPPPQTSTPNKNYRPAPVPQSAPEKIRPAPTPQPPPEKIRPAPQPPSNDASTRVASPPPRNTGWGAPPRSEPKGTPAFQAPPKTEDKKEEKKAQDDRRAKEKEFQKKEDEYVKSKENVRQMEDYRRRRAHQSYLNKTVDHVNCSVEIFVQKFEVRLKNGKPEFVVFQLDIFYDEADWTIFRRWKQVTDMDSIFRRDVKGYTDCMAKIEKPRNKFDPTFQEQRARALQDYLNIITNSRGAIFSSKIATEAFFRFIAPTQLGDMKPPGFVLPFKLSQ